MSSRFPADGMMKAATVLNPTLWPVDGDEKVLYGDNEVAMLAKAAGISVSIYLLSVPFFVWQKQCARPYLCIRELLLCVCYMCSVFVPDIAGKA